MEILYNSDAPQALWKPSVWPVYLVHGEEDRLKQELVKALIAHLVQPDFADFDLERLDAASSGADAILAAAGQIPFGSDRRVVVVTGMEQWRDRGKLAEAERLADGLSRMGENGCLILVAAAEDEEAKRKTAVTTKLDNAVKRIGAMIACRSLKGESLQGWVIERARKEGVDIRPDAAVQLIEVVGGEMRSLETEIVKLACYVGERKTITARDVATVAASSPEDVMFTMIDAVLRRQTDRALTLLGELHRYDPKPQAVAGKLLALLARQYRVLWQARFLVDKRIGPRDVRALPMELAAELPTESNIAQLAFKAADLFGLARQYSWAELTAALDLLLICDLANKGGATDETGVFGSEPVSNLQLLVLQLTGLGKRAASGVGRT